MTKRWREWKTLFFQWLRTLPAELASPKLDDSSELAKGVEFWFSFKVTPELVEPFLDGMTLEEALKKKKIYIVNLKKLSDVMCRFNRVVSKMTGILIILFY